MIDWLMRRYRDLPWYGQVGSGALVAGIFAAVGWFPGYLFWHSSWGGLIAGLVAASLAYSMTNAKMRPFIIVSVISFVLGVPLIYALVLLTEIPLVAFGLVPFSAHAYFVRPILGALVGTGLCAFLNLRATASKVKDRITSEPYSDEWDGMWQWHFNAMSVYAGLAFTIAAVFVIPRPKVAALIILGAAWGVVAAVMQYVFTALIDRQPVSGGWGWFRISLIEIWLGIALVVGLFQSLSNSSYPEARQILELVTPAAITCAATYGLVYLIAIGAALLQAAGKARATEAAGHSGSNDPDIPHTE